MCGRVVKVAERGREGVAGSGGVDVGMCGRVVVVQGIPGVEEGATCARTIRNVSNDPARE